MKTTKNLFVSALATAISVAFSTTIVASGAAESVDEETPDAPVVLPAGTGTFEPPGTVLYDNGPQVNGEGTGVGGADESILQSISLSMGTLGYAHQSGPNNRVADDFVVPAGGFNIAGFVFFAYQTGSTTTSTMTDVNYRIWDGEPGNGGTVIYGDTSTDQLATTEWSGIYRVSETSTGTSSARPIMAQVVTAELDGGLSLDPGTYWVDWSTGGSLGSGPWAPPLTVEGVCESGNGLQFFGGSWGPVVDNFGSSCQEGLPFLILGNEGEGPARFEVTKDFNDDNPMEVDVEITCNTGLPLSQPSSISEGDGVTFVVNDFETETLTCVVTETVPAGYSASYSANEGPGSDESCVFENVEAGSFNTCEIFNDLDEVDVDVTKVWMDENPQFNGVNFAEAEWSCSNVAFDCEDEGPEGDFDCDSGYLNFLGNPGEDSFSVFPSWDGGTTCSVYEVNIADGSVEVDDSDCASIQLWPGQGGSCTIYNTRLYAGIPTLSEYGLAVLALLMLGMGFVGFRRFV